MGVQGGAGFQQTSSTFNAGAINGLNYLMASNSLGTSYELRISLDATYASSGDPVFAGDTISLYLQSTESGGNEWFPNYSSSPEAGLLYTLAAAPAPEPSVLALLACGGVFTIAVIARRRRNYSRTSRRFSE